MPEMSRLESIDDDGIAVLRSYRPKTFPQRVATFAALDEHFARNWLGHQSRLFARTQLDRRTRLLVLCGQYTMLGNLAGLEETLEVALDDGVDPRELLEVILQCYVYAGESIVGNAAQVFFDVAHRRRLLDDLRESSLTEDVTTTARSLEEERRAWSADDAADPRLPGLLERYGWWGISAGLRLRPGHHLNLVTTLDALDPDFLQIWLDSMYQGMYSRRVLDDRTRLLCVVGNCFAVGETHQSRRHARAALRNGATPRELLELVFQSCAVVGHPHMLPMAVDDLIMILDDEGRLPELVPDERIDELRRIVAARVAKRHGVQEMETRV